MNPTDLGRRLRAAAAAPQARRRRTRVLAVESLEPRDCPAPVVSIELPRTPIIEGDRATFTVRLSQPSSTPQRIAVSAVAETATLGRDFMFSNPTQLLFTPGQTVKTFSVQTFTDTVTEPIETFRINATPLTIPNAATVSARASIYELVETTVTAQDVRITEGNTGTVNATFTLTLSGRPTLPVYVNYTTQDVTATAGTDYTAASGQVFFNPGQTTKTVTVPIAGDQIAEFDETFRLQLSTQTRGSTIVTPTVTGTIVNDELDSPGFQIALTYADPALTAAQKNVFERAVARIQQIIIGDLPSVVSGGTFIDDIQITAYVDVMDPGLNGYAFASAWRSGPGGLPYAGEIHLNASRINNPGIWHTAIHEMLHAMGFYSSFFTATGTVSGLGTANPFFTGVNAVREYNNLFGLTSSPGVPLHGNIAETGSYGSHWATGTIGTEIMSVGWDTTSLALRPFSRITVGALADIGYIVDYAAADAYSRPLDPAVTAAITTATVTTGQAAVVNNAGAVWGTGPQMSTQRPTASRRPEPVPAPSPPTTTAGGVRPAAVRTTVPATRTSVTRNVQASAWSLLASRR